MTYATHTKRPLKVFTMAILGLLCLMVPDQSRAQVQPFLNARNPFFYDGVATRALIGPKESTVAVAGASVIQGWYGEVNWDVEGLLGSNTTLKAKAPSFLVKFAPLTTPLAPHVNTVWTVSIGTHALSGLDAYAGAGIYEEDGRFALGGGLNVDWDKVDDDRLSGATYSWVVRGYTKLMKQVSVDFAAKLSQDSGDRASGDLAVIYQPFSQSFQVYLGFLDVFSDQVERRIGMSYAVGF